MNDITDHGIVLPDPAVSFDDEGYEPSKNDHPAISDAILKAIQNLDINFF